MQFVVPIHCRFGVNGKYRLKSVISLLDTCLNLFR